MPDQIPQILYGVFVVVVFVFFVNGIDELIFDLVFLVWRVVKRVIFRKHHLPLTESLLAGEPEKPAAILVPAWHEAGVIGAMLEHNLRNLRYSNYHIFVGVYPNDPSTRAAVEDVAARHGNVHVAVLNHPGPTNKADCLNGIFAVLPAYEHDLRIQFEIFVINDAEDAAPRYELKIFNHLIPRKDIIQLPVFPIPVRWWEFTGGHYLDEFAHMHLRDMRVREWLTGAIPTAGVGCGFSRRCIEAATRHGNGLPFDTDSLTEDYEFSLKLSAAGMEEIFFDDIVRPRPERLTGLRWADQLPAVTEAFPRRFWPSVRQKTRWILGIALQGWDHLGWRASWSGRYMFLRDRKVLVNSVAILLGYVFVIALMGVWAARIVMHDDVRFPVLIQPEGWLWGMLMANFGFMLLQLATRVAAVWTIYGPGDALLSIPRAIWGNVINTVATFRAMWQFATAWRSRKALVWEKTQHEYPHGHDAE